MSLTLLAGSPAPVSKPGTAPVPAGPVRRSSTPAPAPAARVELSPQAARLRGHAALLRTALQSSEEDVERALRARFDEAGRAAYLAAIAQPTDLSPEATAERILGGITGYIYRAFRLTRPDASADDLAEFERGVRTGFERGMKQARAILEGLRALDPELADGVDQTETRVSAGLDRFFQNERDALAARPPAPDASRRS